jgi:hypothetical protein
MLLLSLSQLPYYYYFFKGTSLFSLSETLNCSIHSYTELFLRTADNLRLKTQTGLDDLTGMLEFQQITIIIYASYHSFNGFFILFLLSLGFPLIFLFLFFIFKLSLLGVSEIFGPRPSFFPFGNILTTSCTFARYSIN